MKYFLNYFNAVKPLLEKNIDNIQKDKVINEINEHKNMKVFLDSMINNRMKSLKKNTIIDDYECYEEHTFVDSYTFFRLKELFAEQNYELTFSRITKLDDKSYILECSYEMVELCQQNETYDFTNRFIVVFNSYSGIESFLK